MSLRWFQKAPSGATTSTPAGTDRGHEPGSYPGELPRRPGCLTTYRIPPATTALFRRAVTNVLAPSAGGYARPPACGANWD